MPKKIAIDWDEQELRLVAAQCSGGSVKVTDAAVIPIENANVMETLRTAISQRGLESTDALIAIGRGKAELRELQLPPVPDDELPEMVRFQAIRSFASAGERATVDYLVTARSERGIEMIAAAVGPDSLSEIRETCEAAELSIQRIGLRPLAAAALYLTNQTQSASGDTVLIDLLADDAEIVVARDGHVIFVRSVRMPSGAAARPKALAGELRRSLVACGSSGSLQRVILWGLESVHREDIAMLVEASGSKVDVLDPFDLVDVERKIRGSLPEHVGRLAPLVGLIASDELHGDRLIDFLNPRKRVEAKPNPFKNVLMIGLPIAAALLIAFLGYRHLKSLDTKITNLKNENAKLQPDVDDAIERIAKTEKIDSFLDVDVNWLEEFRRLAANMPPSDEMIIRNISATGDIRNGGGKLSITGGAVDFEVIKQFEEALRDDDHGVAGDRIAEQQSKDAYSWTASEEITVSGVSVRNSRYEGLSPENQAAAESSGDSSEQETSDNRDATEQQPPDDSPAEDSPPDDSPAEDSPPEDSPAEDSPAEDSPAEDTSQEAPAAAAESVTPVEETTPAENTPAEETPAESDESQPDAETDTPSEEPAGLASEKATEVQS